jgi:serine/threonine-protein kinase
MRALAKDRTQRWQSAREMQGAIEEFVRKERLGVSTIALSKFMQGLFEDKLASQKEALLQGKQLADIIALEQSADSLSSINTHTPISSTGGAVRTLTEAPSAPGRGRGLWIAAGAAAIVLTAAGIALWARAGRTEAIQAAPAAEAPPVRGVIAIASDPPGAAIVVNGEVRAETTPATLPRLALGTPYELRLTKDGFEPATQTVTLTDLDPSSAVSVVLVRSAAAADSAVAAAPAGKGAPAGHSPEKSAGGATPAVAAGSGKLNVGARGGWCNVVIDGAGRGPTPVAGVVLTAGTHTVMCTPEGGLAQSASVKVEPDATARFSFTLPQ